MYYICTVLKIESYTGYLNIFVFLKKQTRIKLIRYLDRCEQKHKISVYMFFIKYKHLVFLLICSNILFHHLTSLFKNYPNILEVSFTMCYIDNNLQKPLCIAIYIRYKNFFYFCLPFMSMMCISFLCFISI